MYINPILVGFVTALIFEVVALIIYGIAKTK